MKGRLRAADFGPKIKMPPHSQSRQWNENVYSQSPFVTLQPVAQPGPNSPPPRKPYTGPRTHYSSNKHEFRFTMSVKWVPFMSSRGDVFAMPFVFYPYQCAEFVQECRRHSTFAFMKCTCHIQRDGGKPSAIIGPSRHVTVPSRAFATRSGPYLNALPVDPKMIVAPQNPQITNNSPWVAESRQKKFDASSQFGFYPFTVVGMMGPSVQHGEASAVVVYPQVHNAKDYMPTSWGAPSNCQIPDLSAQSALPFWGPYLSTDLGTDGIQPNEEITINMILDCQFKD